MDKYAQLERFNHDLRLKVCIYDFMYVDTETIPVEDYFQIQKHLLITTINVNSRTSPKTLACI